MLEKFVVATFNPIDVEREMEARFEDEVVSRRDKAEARWEFRMKTRDLEIARFRLAALLPTLAEQMEEVWVPLKKQIAKAGRRHTM